MGLLGQLTVLLGGIAATLGFGIAAASLFESLEETTSRPATALTFFTITAVVAALIFGARRLFTSGQGGIGTLLASSQPHGKLARHVLLIILVLMPLVGWLRFAAERAGVFGTEVGVALMVGVSVLMTTVVLAAGVDWVERAFETRLELERTLAAQRALFEGVIQQMPVGVIIAAPSGQLIGCNRKAKEILDDPTLGSGSIDYGQRKWKVFYPDGRVYPPGEWPLVRSLTKGEFVVNEEIRIEREDGRERTTINSAAPVRDASGAVIAAVVSFMDITGRKEIEEERSELLRRTQEAVASAEQANRIKDDFLAVLSHELRTPLNAILGWTHMLQHGHVTGATAREALDTIERNARAQTALVRDLLDVSSIMSGKLRLHSGPVKLSDVVDAAIETFVPAAVAKGIRISRMVDVNAGVIEGDPHRLHQAVGNLLSNAVKFTPPGGVVEIALRRIDSMAEVSVSDSGIGIRPDMLPHVFDRFRQGEGRATRTFEGLGLGLSIARDLVELHGGTIEASSGGEGRGATFRIRLPVQVGPKPEIIGINPEHPPIARTSPELPLEVPVSSPPQRTSPRR